MSAEPSLATTDEDEEFGTLQTGLIGSASTAAFVPGSGMVASAPSFNPSRPSFVPATTTSYSAPTSPSHFSFQSTAGSYTAAPFIPSIGGSPPGGAAAQPPPAPAVHTSRSTSSLSSAAYEAPAFVPGGRAPEKMVQVTRNGCIFFVPESEALAEAAASASEPAAAEEAFGGDASPASGLVESWTRSTTPGPPGVKTPAPSPGRGASPATTQQRGASARVVPTPRRADSRGASLGVSPQLEAQLEAQSHDMLRQMEPDDERYNEIPPEYGAASPLDHYGADAHGGAWGVAGSFGYTSTMYKVVNRRTGLAYALRRVDGARTSPKVAAAVQARWAGVRHSNIVSLRRSFVHAGATYFVHEYCPCARTALEHYFAPTASHLSSLGGLIPEATLWTHLLQLVAALRVVHAAGLACRSIGLSRLLLTSGGRLRLGSTGVLEVLEADLRKSPQEAQQEDIVAVGHVILALATRSLADAASTRQHLADAGAMMYRVRSVAATYSRELHALVIELLTKPPSVFALCDMLSGRAFDELDAGYRSADALEGHVAAEVGAGRLLRLLLYLGLTLFGRQGRDGGNSTNSSMMNQNPAWRETGDRYLLVLFSDFVFHQVDERQRPVLDHGHLVSCLKKLDASDPEQILLTSRDGRTIFVSSYQEVRRALDDVYAKLHRASLAP